MFFTTGYGQKYWVPGLKNVSPSCQAMIKLVASASDQVGRQVKLYSYSVPDSAWNMARWHSEAR